MGTGASLLPSAAFFTPVRFNFPKAILRSCGESVGKCNSGVRSSLENFEYLEEPSEPTLPKFTRMPYSDGPLAPVDASASSSDAASSEKRKRRRKSQRKVTPAEAMVGAGVGGVWAVLMLKVTLLGHEHLQLQPPAHDLPLGLATHINQLLLTVFTGFGGLAVFMFGMSSFGLILLSIKLLKAPKPPRQ